MFGTVSFFPKSATPALVIVPFGARVTRVNSTIVGLPPEGTPLNASTQPLKFDGGAVDARPLTPVGGDRYALWAAPAAGPHAAHACFMVVELAKFPAHVGIPAVLILPSSSNSRVTVFANPPWALSPGAV